MLRFWFGQGENCQEKPQLKVKSFQDRVLRVSDHKPSKIDSENTQLSTKNKQNGHEKSRVTLQTPKKAVKMKTTSQFPIYITKIV